MSNINKRRQDTLLQILKDFAKFCDENDIAYFLDYGTLLGAVRHQGFIPWDDDIDVCMDVKNYRKLMKLAHKLPERYFFQNFRTDPKVSARWSRIRMNGTTALALSQLTYDVHAGFGIDVFAVCGVARTKLGRLIQKAAYEFQDAILYKDWAEAMGRPVSGKVKLLYKLLPGKLRLWVAALLERIMMLDTHHSDKVFNLCTRKDVAPSSLFYADKRVKLQFEDEMFWCPEEYEKVLEAYYGEWWVIPPIEEQETHGEYILDFENDYRMYLQLK